MEARELTLALRKLANFVDAHPHRDHLAARLWCYEFDADWSAELGHDVIDQTLGDVLHAMLWQRDDAESACRDRGLLDNLGPADFDPTATAWEAWETMLAAYAPRPGRFRFYSPAQAVDGAVRWWRRSQRGARAGYAAYLLAPYADGGR